MKRGIIDYANLPREEWPEVISKQDALDGGKKRYFTGDPCRRGHVSERSSNGACLLCQKERYQRPEFKEKQREYKKEYNQRPKIKERLREYNKEYNQRPKIKERLREYNKEYNQRPKIKERARKNRDAINFFQMLGAMSTLSQIKE